MSASKCPIRLTYQTLSRSAHAAATDLLRQSVGSDDPAIAELAVGGLLTRWSSDAHRVLYELWPSHRETIVAMVHRCDDRESMAAFFRTLAGQLTAAEVSIAVKNRWLEMAEACGVIEATEALIDLSMSCPHPAVRARASQTLLRVVEPLGRIARGAADGRQTRCEVTLQRKRLAWVKRLHRYLAMAPGHGHLEWIDAFLSLSSWKDAMLNDALDDTAAIRPILLRRLQTTTEPGAVALLAHSLRRRRLPRGVIDILRDRVDREFRDALLDAITDTPEAVLAANLAESGLPECLTGGREQIPSLSPDRAVALVRVVSHTRRAGLEPIAMGLDVLAAHGLVTAPAVALAFSRCSPPELITWAEWLSPGPWVSDSTDAADELVDDEAPPPPDPSAAMAAEVIRRLLPWLDSEVTAVRTEAQRLLGAIHGNAYVRAFTKLTLDQRQLLGPILLRVDPLALHAVRDGLRHPVMKQRLAAIDCAVSLALIDELLEPLEIISIHDHQSVRIRTAQALAAGTTDQSLVMLQRLAGSVQASVQEAALSSLRQRSIAPAEVPR